MACPLFPEVDITCISVLSLLLAGSCQGWGTLAREGPFPISWMCMERQSRKNVLAW